MQQKMEADFFIPAKQAIEMRMMGYYINGIGSFIRVTEVVNFGSYPVRGFAVVNSGLEVVVEQYDESGRYFDFKHSALDLQYFISGDKLLKLINELP